MLCSDNSPETSRNGLEIQWHDGLDPFSPLFKTVVRFPFEKRHAEWESALCAMQTQCQNSIRRDFPAPPLLGEASKMHNPTYKVAVFGGPEKDLFIWQVSALYCRIPGWLSSHLRSDIPCTQFLQGSEELYNDDADRKRCTVDGEDCVLDIVSTSGLEAYSSMMQLAMRTSEGFLLLYSVTDRESFERVTSLRQQITQVKDSNYFPMVVVADYHDDVAGRRVSKEEGEALVRGFDSGCPFVEVNTKTGLDVKTAFYGLVREMRWYSRFCARWPDSDLYRY
jgi:hypothetical protein